MSAWDEALDASVCSELFFEDASEQFRALQELVGEWQEIRSVSTDTADDVDKAQSMRRITQAATAHAIQVRCIPIAFISIVAFEIEKFKRTGLAQPNVPSFPTAWRVRKPIRFTAARCRDTSSNK